MDLLDDIAEFFLLALVVVVFGYGFIMAVIAAAVVIAVLFAFLGLLLIPGILKGFWEGLHEDPR